MAKMIIEGEAKKIKQLRRELELKIKRNGLVFKEDDQIVKKDNEKKEVKKKVIKK